MRANFIGLGYCSILLPPLALFFGVHFEVPWLAFVLFVAASPITRAVFGTHPAEPLLLSERTASLLHALPAFYFCVLLACLVASAAGVFVHPIVEGISLTAFGLSLWTVMVFGTFPAHEMVHRRSKVWIRIGSFAGGLCGYPILGLEDAVHHARPGNVSAAEWPSETESVWNFVARRSIVCIRNSLHQNASLKATGEWAFGAPLIYGFLGLLFGLSLFAALVGFIGLVVYLCSVAGVMFSMQVMKYVQHWGLGDDGIADAGARELAWEDDCQMQSWLTLSNSFHLSHHRSRDAAYCFLSPAPDSPRQPGCYVMMLGACLIPQVWRSLMLPVLWQWKEDGNLVCQPGRWALCISPSRRMTLEKHAGQRSPP